MLHNLSCDKRIYEYIRRGHANGLKLEYERTAREWQLQSYSNISKKWYVDASYPPGLSVKTLPDSFTGDAIGSLSVKAMLDILNTLDDIVLLPLYLYDHSGLTMNTTGFSCPWDSGVVGWVYADKAMIEREYDAFTKETSAKATSQMQAEVETYDLFLTGQSYGYSLYEGEQEIDSCYGFLGDMDSFSNELKSILPEENRHLVDKLEANPFNSIGDYFWHQKHLAS